MTFVVLNFNVIVEYKKPIILFCRYSGLWISGSIVVLPINTNGFQVHLRSSLTLLRAVSIYQWFLINCLKDDQHSASLEVQSKNLWLVLINVIYDS